jgi:hypothetical protein
VSNVNVGELSQSLENACPRKDGWVHLLEVLLREPVPTLRFILVLHLLEDVLVSNNIAYFI